MEAWTEEQEVSEQQDSSPEQNTTAWQDALNAASKVDEEASQEERITLDEDEKRGRMYGNSPVDDEEEGLRTKEVVGVTENGKEIQVVKHPVYAGYYAEFTSGGELPEDLDQMFTTFDRARKAVNLYIAKRNEKVNEQG